MYIEMLEICVNVSYVCVTMYVLCVAVSPEPQKLRYISMENLKWTVI